MLKMLARRSGDGRVAASSPTHAYRKGSLIYLAATHGGGWRVVQGVVRLSSGPETRFAGLALPGDVIGIEALLHDSYGYTTHALTHCVLEPWQSEGGLETTLSLLRLMEAAGARTAEVVALRNGSAEERICRLLAMVRKGQGGSSDRIVLPSLRDIAEITAMTIETCSRIICDLRRRYLGERSKGTISLAWPLPAGTESLDSVLIGA